MGLFFSNKNALSDSTPIPRKKMMCVFLMQFCEAFNANSLFAYVGFLIIDFNIVDDEADVGYYAGLIASSFFFCQFLSSFLWGMLSDRLGRRPVLLIGLAGALVSAALFGFSKSLAFAITTRCISGLLNGTLAVNKTYLGEVTDRTNQALAFSLFSLAWSSGSILGPMAGGFLSQPTAKYDWFPKGALHGLLHEYPFLLPSLLTASFTLITLVLCYFYLEETLPRAGYQKEYTPLISHSSGTPQKNTHNNNNNNNNKYSNNKTRVSELLKDRVAMLMCVVYGIFGFTHIVFVEVVPLWAIAKPNIGGLGFDTSKVGIIQGCAGAYNAVMQMLFYPPLAKRIGVRKVGLYSCLLLAPLVLNMTEVRFLLPDNNSSSSKGGSVMLEILFWTALIVVYAVIFQCVSFGFSSTNMMMNNSVPFEKMGALNGLAQSITSLMRTFGPTVGASLFAWSVRRDEYYFLSCRFTFILCAILYVCVALLVQKLPHRVNTPFE